MSARRRRRQVQVEPRSDGGGGSSQPSTLTKKFPSMRHHLDGELSWRQDDYSLSRSLRLHDILFNGLLVVKSQTWGHFKAS